MSVRCKLKSRSSGRNADPLAAAALRKIDETIARAEKAEADRDRILAMLEPSDENVETLSEWAGISSRIDTPFEDDILDERELNHDECMTRTILTYLHNQAKDGEQT